jgi:hypothetical protein
MYFFASSVRSSQVLKSLAMKVTVSSSHFESSGLDFPAVAEALDRSFAGRDPVPEHEHYSIDVAAHVMQKVASVASILLL